MGVGYRVKENWGHTIEVELSNLGHSKPKIQNLSSFGIFMGY